MKKVQHDPDAEARQRVGRTFSRIKQSSSAHREFEEAAEVFADYARRLGRILL